MNKRKHSFILLLILALTSGFISAFFSPSQNLKTQAAVVASEIEVSLVVNNNSLKVNSGLYSQTVTVDFMVKNETPPIQLFGASAVVCFDANIFEYTGFIASTGFGESSLFDNKVGGVTIPPGGCSEPGIAEVKISLTNQSFTSAANVKAGSFTMKVKSGVTPPTTLPDSESRIYFKAGSLKVLNPIASTLTPSKITEGKVTFTGVSANTTITYVEYNGIRFDASNSWANTVPYSTSKLNVSNFVTNKEAAATLSFNNVSAGTNNITTGQVADLSIHNPVNLQVVVTAENGTSKATYPITVTRAAGDADNSIGSLVVKNGATTMTGTWSGDTFIIDGAFEVPYAQRNDIKITASPTSSKATMTIKEPDSTAKTLPANTATAVTLKEGTNNIIIAVKSETGTEKPYTVRIKLTNAETDDTLATLAFADGIGPLNSTPENLSPSESIYSVQVSVGQTSVMVSATTTSAKAKIIVNSVEYASLVNESFPVGTLYITVRPEKGADRTYTVLMSYPTLPSSDNEIQNITVEGYPSLGFDKDSANVNYYLTVPYRVEFVNIVVTRNAAVRVSIEGTKMLQVGENLFVIYGINESNEQGTRYNLYITRQEDAQVKLAALSVVGFDFDTPFVSTEKYYYLTVPKNVNSITINAAIETGMVGYYVTGANGTTWELMNSGVDSPNIIPVLIFSYEDSFTSVGEYFIVVTRLESQETVIKEKESDGLSFVFMMTTIACAGIAIVLLFLLINKSSKLKAFLLFGSTVAGRPKRRQ